MFGIGTTELLVILVIIVMLFGLGKLPQAARQIGLGARNFQKGLKGEDDEPKKISNDQEEKVEADWVDEVEKRA